MGKRNNLIDKTNQSNSNGDTWTNDGKFIHYGQAYGLSISDIPDSNGVYRVKTVQLIKK